MKKCKHVLGPPNAIRAACTKCGAMIGKPCFSVSKVHVQPHKARRDAYAKAMSQIPQEKPQ